MTTTRRILLASPLRSAASARYIADIVAAMTTRIPDVSFSLRLVSGPVVHWARNELAHAVLAGPHDELLFIDADLPFTTDQLARLCSHHVPIVCGLYAARTLDTAWTTKGIRGEEPDENGLVKVAEAALGFSKITKSALQQIAENHPERSGLMTAHSQPPTIMQDFFPMGITGPNTPEARIENMKKLFATYANNGMDPKQMGSRELQEFINKIERLLTIRYPQISVYRSEDFLFCQMARASGLDVLLDSKLVLPHEDTVGLPLPTEQLERMLAEPWRQPDRAEETKS